MHLSSLILRPQVCLKKCQMRKVNDIIITNFVWRIGDITQCFLISVELEENILILQKADMVLSNQVARDGKRLTSTSLLHLMSFSFLSDQ